VQLFPNELKFKQASAIYKIHISLQAKVLGFANQDEHFSQNSILKMASSIRSLPAQPNSACTTPSNRVSITSHPTRRATVISRASLRKDQELITALWRSLQKESLPWLQDLAIPALGVPDPEFSKPDSDNTLPPASLADPDSKFITVAEDVRLHYKERRSSAKNQPTILLIHGFNGSTFSWRANIDAIADATGCRVLSVDRPPFGLSSRPLEFGNKGNSIDFNPYELDGSVKLMEMFLGALNIDGPIIPIGHSAGALVALELARRNQNKITSLALVAPAVPTNSEHSLLRRATFGSQLRFLAIRAILGSDQAGLRYVRRQLLKQKEKVEQGDLGFTPHPSTASSMLSSSSYSSYSSSIDFQTTNTDEDAAVAASLWESAAQQAIEEAAEGYTRPLRAEDWDRAALLNLRAFMLPSVYDYSCIDELPVLVVSGEDDGALTQNAAALVEILQERRDEKKNGSPSPVALYKEMPCGHVPMEEMPFEFNETLIDFLKTHAL
jgi:pimeloyl-ACP methyl ester carboxylesterase